MFKIIKLIVFANLTVDKHNPNLISFKFYVSWNSQMNFWNVLKDPPGDSGPPGSQPMQMQKIKIK